MNRLLIFEATVCLGLGLLVTGCGRKVTAQQGAEAGTGPAPTTVQPDLDSNNFKVDHP